MYRKLTAAAASVALVGGIIATAPAEADAAATPSKITSVKAAPGPGAGQVTFRWATEGKNTSGFTIETAVNSFSKSSSSALPTTGRNAKVWKVAKTKRSLTLSAAQVGAAGASVASANHLYFRVSAVNGKTTRAYPYLQAVLPKPAAPKTSGTALRMGTFNVLSANIDDGPQWLSRAGDVAREIRDQNPGIVALQELSPGRADGKKESTTGSVRQTASLVSALRSAGAGQYRLVRESPFIQPGVTHGSQGARILYDTGRYRLLSTCAETTGKRNYSPSCSMDLPKLSGDGRSAIRSASYARFQDRRTGTRLWVASVHLDARHSDDLRQERALDALRAAQVKAVHTRINKLKTRGDKLVIAGDINSWQNNKGGNSPHDYLVRAGYADTASAPSRVNANYPTVNHFQPTLPPSSLGVGTRLDVVMVKGGKGSKRFVNVTRAQDSSRPSDHNLVVSDVVL